MNPIVMAPGRGAPGTFVPLLRTRVMHLAFIFLVSLLMVRTAQAQNIRIVNVDPNTEWITIKNFGTETVDISNYWLCQRPQYDRLGDEGAINVVFGDLVLSPGEEVLFSVIPGGQSGEFSPITELPDNGELGLFSEPSFGSTDPHIFLDFVTWGGITEPTRVEQAVTAGRWDASGSFVTGIAPFDFIGDGHDVGADFWKGTANVRIVNVDPTTDWVTIKNFGTEPIDISSYWLCQRPQYDQLGDEGAISIVTGDLFLDPDEEVIVNVNPGGQSGSFNAIVDLKANDELGLFTESNFGSTDPAVFIDFVSWGGVTDPTRAEQAVSAGRWDAADSFVRGIAPFVYLGGANNVGASFWEGGEVEFSIRIVDVDPATEWVTIKNFSTETIDISNYWLCQRPQYDRLGDSGSIRVVFGDLVLGPEEEVLISVSPAGPSGEFPAITDLPENGELGLFAEASFGSTDPTLFLDFVSWGGITEPTRAEQAVSAGRWDAANSFVDGLAPFEFFGDIDDVGANFWQGRVIDFDIRIVDVDPATEWVTIKNLGTETIDISGYWLCQRPKYDQLGDAGAIRVVFGDLVLDPEEEVLISVSPAGQSGGFSAITDLPENGELGLFAEAEFGSTNPDILLDFVSWGGVTEPTRAEQAVAAGRWDTPGSFAEGNAPFTFIGEINAVGARFWEGQEAGAIVRITYVDPINEWVTIKNFGTEAVDISNYWLCQRPQYDQLSESGSISIVAGDFQLEPGEEVVIDISPSGASGGFTPITDLPDNGELGLFADATFGSTDPATLLDFVSWGGVTEPTRAGQAVEAGRWDTVESFVVGNAPFSYFGGANDVGAVFWEGEEGAAIVRITAIDLSSNWVTIRNFGNESVDISNYWLCQRPQYDQLGEAGSISIITGDLQLDPGEEVIVDVSPNGPSGGFTAITDLPENGELGLFSSANFGSTDPVDLLDFVSWGGVTQPTRANQALTAGRWDAVERFVEGNSPFTYIGGANDVGASFWEGEEVGEALVRIAAVDPINEWVTIKNFGNESIDISGYWLCQRPQYDQLSEAGSITIIEGDFQLEPGEEVVVDVSPAGSSGGFTAITDLPDNGELGLFSEGSFGSTDPAIFLDFVSWGGVTEPTRAEQAVTAQRWNDAVSFVAGAPPYVFLGDTEDVGSEFWVGDTEIRIVLINPLTDIVVLENADDVAVDISSFFFCTQAGVYPQLGDSEQVEVVEGDLNLEPGEKVAVRILTEGGVVDEDATLFLFATDALGFNNGNPYSLRDFAQWDVPNGFRVENAVVAGRWDDADAFIDGEVPFFVESLTPGVFGSIIWATRTSTVRMVRVDPVNSEVTIRNFGDNEVDLSGYFFCLNIGEYEQLGGNNLLLGPGGEVAVQVTTGLDANNPDNLGLFSSNTFNTTNPNIYVDFVQWGGRDDQGRPGQAVFAGIWVNGNSFVEMSELFEFTGDVNDFGVGNWSPVQNVSVDSPFEELPTTTTLETNYPNPFNPETTIAFSLVEGAQVQLVVYDVIGRQVATLVDGVLSAGRHEVRFLANGLPSGTYLYRLVTPSGVIVKKMSLLK